MSSSLLYDMASDLLGAAETAIGEPCTGHALPGRRYVSFDEPAHDLCTDDDTDGSGQLVVWWGPIVPTVQTRGKMCVVQPRGQLCVELARCVPDLDENGQPFPAATYDAAAEFMLTEAWPLLRGVTDWLAGLGCTWRVIQSGISSVGGGMAAFRVCAEVEINDPDPTCTPT